MSNTYSSGGFLKNARKGIIRFLLSLFLDYENLIIIFTAIVYSFMAPPYPFAFLSFIALAPFFYILLRQNQGEAFKKGYIFGFVLYFRFFWWITEVTLPGYLMMGLMLALIPAFFAWISHFIIRRTSIPFYLVYPVVWVLFEFMQSKTVFAFPWLLAGYSLSMYPHLIQIASITTVFGVSFLIILANSFLVQVLRGRLFYIIPFIFIPFLMWFYSSKQLSPNTMTDFNVALAQVNIPSTQKWVGNGLAYSVEKSEDFARKLKGKDVDLVVYPESVVPYYMMKSSFAGRFSRLAQETGMNLCLGFIDYETNRYEGRKTYNSATIIDTDGTIKPVYNKNHLVPFGEYLPFSESFNVIKRMDFGEADFTHGTKMDIYNVENKNFAINICYELLFMDYCRQARLNGCDFLVNITNDSWYDFSTEPYQHYYFAAFRAIETGMPVVRTANTGVSGVFDPYGRAMSEPTGLKQEYIVIENLPESLGETFYVRHGNVFIIITFILGLLAFLKALLSKYI